jgi:glycosyltransferase involved in cell wall biosynthesis
MIFIPSWYPVFNSKGGNYFVTLLKLHKDYYPDTVMLYVHLETLPSIWNKLLSLLLKFKILRILFFNFQKKFLKIEKDANGDIMVFAYTPFSHENQNYYYIHLFMCYDFLYRTHLNHIKQISAQSVEYAGLLAFHLRKKYGDIQYTITEHNYFTSGRFTTKMWPSIRSAFKNAETVYFCSNDKQRQVLATGVEIIRANRRINYNYVPETQKIIRPYIRGNKLNIITVASASHFKDLDILVSTLEQLSYLAIDFCFTLVGFDSWGNSGKYLPLERLKKLGSKITLIGMLSNEDLICELEKNQLFLLTSIAEGMPVSVLEAMELGLICVATQHGGSEEVVINGIHGFINNVGDLDGLVNSILKVFEGKFTHVPELNKRRAQYFCSSHKYAERTFL